VEVIVVRWLMFHADFLPSALLEYAVLNVPDGEKVTESGLLGGLSFEHNYALDPKFPLVLAHRACPLNEAPHEIRRAYEAGKMQDAIPWLQIWHLIDVASR
jgi:hypothetical protein